MHLKIASCPFAVLLFGLVAAGQGFAEPPDRPSKQAPEASSSAGDVTSPSPTAASPHVGGPGALPGADAPNLQTPDGGADNGGHLDAKDLGAQNPPRINTTKDAVDQHPGASVDDQRGSLQTGPRGTPLQGTPAASAGPKETPLTANPIDTSITVQPPRNAKNTPRHHEALKKPHPTSPSAVSARHQNPATGSGGHATRNAIGVPLPPDRSNTHPVEGSRGTTPIVPNAAGPMTAPGVDELASRPQEGGGLTPGAQKIVRPLVTPPTVGPATGINGTGVVRPGHGPGTVGGAAKNLAAINGTTIRPKH